MWKWFYCLLTVMSMMTVFALNNESEAKWIIQPINKKGMTIKLDEQKQIVQRLLSKRKKCISTEKSFFLRPSRMERKKIYKIEHNMVNNNSRINSFVKVSYSVHRMFKNRKKNFRCKGTCFLKRELCEQWEHCKEKTVDFIEKMKRRTATYIKIQKKKFDNNNMISFLWVCKNALCTKGMLFFTFIVMINSAIISIMIPKFDNLLFNDLSNRNLRNFYPLLFQCVLVRIVDMVLCSSRNYIFMMTSAQCIKIVKKILFEIYINKEYEYYDNIDFTTVINILTIEPHEFSDIIPYYVNPFLRNFFSIIFNFGYMFYLNRRLSTVILSCFLFSSFLSVIYSKMKKKRIKLVNRQKAKNTKIALETLNNINIVKLYGTEAHEYNKYKTSLNSILNLQKKKERFSLIHSIIKKFFIFVTYVLIILNGTILLKQESLDEKTFTSFFFYINNIYSYINILDYYIDIVDMVDQYRPIVQLLKRYTLERRKNKCDQEGTYQEKSRDHSSQLVQPVQSVQSNAKKQHIQQHSSELSVPTNSMEVFNGRVMNEKVSNDEILSFENVFFSFASNPSKYVLKNINLKIYKNTNNVIIGKSGGGKSTLLKLMLNLYKPSKGNIYLYKKSLNKYSSREIFDTITYVEQNSKLLNMTIRENLLYGVNKDNHEGEDHSEVDFTITSPFISNNNFTKNIDDNHININNNNNNKNKNINNNNNNKNNKSSVDFDMIDLINVSKCCTCHEFISRLTKRYETIVSSKTQLLTSSQAQKICVARALMRSPKILLLDESTSSLDKDNERQMFENIKNNSFFKNITIIRITHKKANLSLCDSIFTLKDGYLTKTR